MGGISTIMDFNIFFTSKNCYREQQFNVGLRKFFFENKKLSPQHFFHVTTLPCCHIVMSITILSDTTHPEPVLYTFKNSTWHITFLGTLNHVTHTQFIWPHITFLGTLDQCSIILIWYSSEPVPPISEHLTRNQETVSNYI